MLDFVREGRAIAKLEGKYKGRKEVKVDNFEEYYNRYLNREFNKTQLAKELGVSRPTLDKLIKEHESK
jgi:DNA invertase Pin-like site-specific DNA recombinase